MRQAHAFDTHGDLLIQRYKHGLRLIRPDTQAESTSQKSISCLYHLAMPVFFMGHHDVVVDGNDASAELVGAPSTRDLPGKTLRDFYDRQTEKFLSNNNKNVIQSKSMHILEEEGTRIDNMPFHYIAFKFPVYDTDNKIMGLLGCCIKINNDSLSHFGSVFSQFMSTGLLNASQPLINNYHGIEFSRREKNVLAQLIRGKTAKQIGECLNLSPRTIESYIENMKIKTRCKSKSELVDRFIDAFY